MTGRKRSQRELMLELLRDGRWHSNGEIADRARTMRPNSRAAELRPGLRAEGLDVVHEKRDGVDGYRLVRFAASSTQVSTQVSPREGAARSTPATAASELSHPPAPQAETSAGPAPHSVEESGQLVLGVAA